MKTSAFFQYPDGEDEAAPSQHEQLVLLPQLTEAEWRTLLSYTTARRFRAGELVMAEGEHDRTLYIVSEGTLAAWQRLPNGKQRQLGLEITAGSVVGEIAFFDGQPRSASIVATGEGELLALTEQAFDVLAAREPSLARALLLDLGRVLALRLRRSQDPTLH